MAGKLGAWEGSLVKGWNAVYEDIVRRVRTEWWEPALDEARVAVEARVAQIDATLREREQGIEAARTGANGDRRQLETVRAAATATPTIEAEAARVRESLPKQAGGD